MIEREFPNAVVSYDQDTNSVYVYIAREGDKIQVGHTAELVPGVNLDIDRFGRLVGVEVV